MNIAQATISGTRIWRDGVGRRRVPRALASGISGSRCSRSLVAASRPITGLPTEQSLVKASRGPVRTTRRRRPAAGCPRDHGEDIS